MIADLLQDLRSSLRMLRKHPGLIIVAALSLALGIGGNAAMFRLINGAFVRLLAYAEPDRLLHLRRRARLAPGKFAASRSASR
jgi:putative ABC transport system permease protein